MVLNGEEGLKCEVHVDVVRLKHGSGFMYLGRVLDEAGTDGAECSKKVVGAIRSLVNARDLQIKCARVLHGTLIVPILTYGSEAMLWKEERSWIRAVQVITSEAAWF